MIKRIVKKLKSLVLGEKSKIGYAANDKYGEQSKKEVEERMEKMKKKYEEEK